MSGPSARTGGSFATADRISTKIKTLAFTSWRWSPRATAVIKGALPSSAMMNNLVSIKDASHCSGIGAFRITATGSSGERSGTAGIARHSAWDHLWLTVIVPGMRPPPRITHCGDRPRSPIGPAIPLTFAGDRHYYTPLDPDSLEVGKRIGCVFRPQERTNFGGRESIGTPVQYLRDAHRAAGRLDLARHWAPCQQDVRSHREAYPLAVRASSGSRARAAPTARKPSSAWCRCPARRIRHCLVIRALSRFVELLETSSGILPLHEIMTRFRPASLALYRHSICREHQLLEPATRFGILTATPRLMVTNSDVGDSP